MEGEGTREMARIKEEDKLKKKKGQDIVRKIGPNTTFFFPCLCRNECF